MTIAAQSRDGFNVSAEKMRDDAFFEGRFLFRIEKSLAFVYFLCYKSDTFLRII